MYSNLIGPFSRRKIILAILQVNKSYEINSCSSNIEPWSKVLVGIKRKKKKKQTISNSDYLRWRGTWHWIIKTSYKICYQYHWIEKKAADTDKEWCPFMFLWPIFNLSSWISINNRVLLCEMGKLADGLLFFITLPSPVNC